MAVYYKPQSPIQSGEDFIYPITTADQIMKSDNSRLEQNGEIVADNSPKLGGIAASEYALKTKTVPTSRTINGKALSENITLSASDVGARPNTWMPSASDVGALPSGGTAADSSKLGGKAPGEYVQKSDVIDLKKITSGTNINGKVPSAQALLDCIYARPGTKFSRTDRVPYAGILTASAKDLRFCIPVPYVVNNGSTVTFTNLIGGIRVSGGGYVSDGSTASDKSNWLSGSAVNTVTGTIYKGILYLNINMKNAVGNASNNTPINAQLGIEFTVN